VPDLLSNRSKFIPSTKASVHYLPPKSPIPTLASSHREEDENSHKCDEYSFLSIICVTRPLTCAIQLSAIANCRSRRWIEPWMVATRTPNEEDAIVDISGVF